MRILAALQLVPASVYTTRAIASSSTHGGERGQRKSNNVVDVDIKSRYHAVSVDTKSFLMMPRASVSVYTIQTAPCQRSPCGLDALWVKHSGGSHPATLVSTVAVSTRLLHGVSGLT